MTDANILPEQANVVGPDPAALPGQPGYRGTTLSEPLAKALADKGEGYASLPPDDALDIPTNEGESQ